MSKADVVVEDCDTCVLKAINGSNCGGITVCAITKTTDTFTCTYGCVPLTCPLIKNDIVLTLKNGIEDMETLQEKHVK